MKMTMVITLKKENPSQTLNYKVLNQNETQLMQSSIIVTWKHCTENCRKSARHWLIIKAYCSYTRSCIAQVI